MQSRDLKHQPLRLVSCAKEVYLHVSQWDNSDLVQPQAGHTSAIVNRIQLCGDMEMNPGPPGQRGGIQTRLSASQGKLGLDSNVSDALSDIMREIKETRLEMNSKIDELGLKLEARYQELQGEVTSLKKELEVNRTKLDDLENRSRRNNIVVHGVEEKEKETWEETEDILCTKLSESLGLTISPEHFERAHRTGKPNSKGRPIIALCNNFKTKKMILKAARDMKPPGLYVNEDFSPGIRSVRQALSKVMKTKRDKGLTAFLSYNKLIVRHDEGMQNIYTYDTDRRRLVQLKTSFIEPTVRVLPDDQLSEEPDVLHNSDVDDPAGAGLVAAAADSEATSAESHTP